ncbi:unnamed protein product, partial [Symbiodinium sp. KB8]
MENPLCPPPSAASAFSQAGMHQTQKERPPVGQPARLEAPLAELRLLKWRKMKSRGCLVGVRVRILNNEDASAALSFTGTYISGKALTTEMACFAAFLVLVITSRFARCRSSYQYATLTVEELLNLKSELVAAQDAWQAAGAQQHEAEASIAQLKDELSWMKASLEQVQEWYRNQDQASMVELKQELVTMKVASQSLQRELEDGAGCRAALAALRDQREQASVAQLKDELSWMKASFGRLVECREQDQAFLRLYEERFKQVDASSSEATTTVEQLEQELLVLKSELMTARQASGDDADIVELKQELAAVKASLERAQESCDEHQVVSGNLQRQLEDAAGSRSALAAALVQCEQELLSLKSEHAAVQDAWQASTAQLMEELSWMKASLEQLQGCGEQDQACASAAQMLAEETPVVAATAPRDQDTNLGLPASSNEGSASMSAPSETPLPTLLMGGSHTDGKSRRPSQTLKECNQRGRLCCTLQAHAGSLWSQEFGPHSRSFGLSGEAKALLRESNRQAEDHAEQSTGLAKELLAKYRSEFGHNPKDGAQLRSFAERHGRQLPFKAA